MVSREHTIIVTGAIIITFVSFILNLVLGINITLSLIVGIIIGIIVGLLVGKLTSKIVLGIIAWGLIVFALLAALLKWSGIISSPPITEILIGGMLIELIRIESKFREELTGIKVKLSFLWNDFKKRKEI